MSGLSRSSLLRMTTQEIRFCTTRDGVRLAYALAGQGPPLVKAANWLNHLEYDWESPVWRHVLRDLASRFRLLRYDERGNGLSDWDIEHVHFDALVEDLETVVDAAGFERFDLLGVSQGCAVSVAYAVRHPGRVNRLVLFGGYARGWRRRGTPREIAQREALTTLVREGWGSDNPAFRQVFSSLFFPDGTTEQMRAFNELQRITASPENAARLIEAFGTIDVTDLLPQVQAPTLVLHCREDGRIPFDAGRELAAGIPGARFVPLESRNHLILEQDAAWPRLRDEIAAFLTGAAPGGAESEVEPSWEEVDALFGEALDLPADRRERWLAERCATRPALRERLQRLLRSSEASDARLRTGGALGGEIGARIAAGEAAGLAAGTQIGPYEILERIGGGGMGTVYRARHHRLDRDVAIKAIATVLAAGSDGMRRFEREAKLLASLDHPNIATVHDFLVVDGHPYLVLELVAGETLSARIERGPLPPAEALRIAAEVADALAEAHGKGIVHRDLKPGNVMVTPKGRVKVLDFGLAKTVQPAGSAASESFATQSMALLGTPGYMSPEQARGQAIDTRTDVWAFGCVLYEMLAGRRAFGAENVPDAIAAVLRDEADPDRLPPDTRPELVELILHCLRKDPAERPQRIEAVAARLRPLAGPESAAGRAPSGTREPPPAGADSAG